MLAKLRIMLKRTMEYEALVDLFVRAGLEISPEDPRPEGLITCFELLDEKDGSIFRLKHKAAPAKQRKGRKRGISMWAYNGVFYQIYPIGFCGAPVRDGGGRTAGGREAVAYREGAEVL